jgi:hypothetical protein
MQFPAAQATALMPAALIPAALMTAALRPRRHEPACSRCQTVTPIHACCSWQRPGAADPGATDKATMPVLSASRCQIPALDDRSPSANAAPVQP